MYWLPAPDEVALVGDVGLVRVSVVLRLVDVLELLLEQVDLVAVVHRVVAVDGTLRNAGGVVGGDERAVAVGLWVHARSRHEDHGFPAVDSALGALSGNRHALFGLGWFFTILWR
jgi:hypothetical protein